jgi:glycosyltransferase involved in cell wall biosynthesis
MTSTLPISHELTLVIPVYNPIEGWEDTLISKYQDFSEAIGYRSPIILVNDGSSKDIAKAVAHIQSVLGLVFTYESYTPNRGKGAAIKHGSQVASTPLTLFTDTDFPYTVDSMVEVYRSLQRFGDVVIGHRPKVYYDEVPSFRTSLSKGLRWFNKILLGLPTDDTQCGLKGFDERGKRQLLTCKTSRFLIDLEFLLKTNHEKLTITPVEVALRPDIEFTKFNPTVLLKEVANFILLILRYRIFRF